MFPQLNIESLRFRAIPIDHWHFFVVIFWWSDFLSDHAVSSKERWVQLSSVVSDSLQPHGLQHKLMSIALVMPCNHLILCHPLLLLPSVFPSIRVFSSELALHMAKGRPKLWSFSFSISPSNEHLGLISFRIDWFAVNGLQSMDSQESFPTPHFKSMNSLALSFLYGPNVTSIHDYWKNRSFD